MSYRDQGDKLRYKGESQLQRKFFASDKYKKAAPYFEQAAIKYQQGQDWMNAGKCYEMMAECSIKMKDYTKAAQELAKAGSCHAHYSSQELVRCYTKAVTLFCENGKFIMAAKLQREIAESLDDLGEFEEAAKQYQKAAQYYEAENAFPNALKCYESQANCLITAKKYKEAFQVFQNNIIDGEFDANLIRVNINDYIFRALLCYLLSMSTNDPKKVNIHLLFTM